MRSDLVILGDLVLDLVVVEERSLSRTLIANAMIYVEKRPHIDAAVVVGYRGWLSGEGYRYD